MRRPMADVMAVAGRVDIPALYQLHWRPLVRLALLLVDDVSSAEDVVQDAFISLHRKADSLRDPDAALAYVRTSVVNLSRSVLRRRHVARKHLKVAEPEATAAADHDVLLRDEHRATLAAVHAPAAAPTRSPDPALLVLAWSEQEIAQTLGISVGSVKSAASRGRAALERVLEGQL